MRQNNLHSLYNLCKLFNIYNTLIVPILNIINPQIAHYSFEEQKGKSRAVASDWGKVFCPLVIMALTII